MSSRSNSSSSSKHSKSTISGNRNRAPTTLSYDSDSYSSSSSLYSDSDYYSSEDSGDEENVNAFEPVSADTIATYSEQGQNPIWFRNPQNSRDNGYQQPSYSGGGSQQEPPNSQAAYGGRVTKQPSYYPPKDEYLQPRIEGGHPGLDLNASSHRKPSSSHRSQKQSQQQPQQQSQQQRPQQQSQQPQQHSQQRPKKSRHQSRSQSDLPPPPSFVMNPPLQEPVRTDNRQVYQTGPQLMGGSAGVQPSDDGLEGYGYGVDTDDVFGGVGSAIGNRWPFEDQEVQIVQTSNSYVGGSGPKPQFGSRTTYPGGDVSDQRLELHTGQKQPGQWQPKTTVIRKHPGEKFKQPHIRANVSYDLDQLKERQGHNIPQHYPFQQPWQKIRDTANHTMPFDGAPLVPEVRPDLQHLNKATQHLFPRINDVPKAHANPNPLWMEGRGPIPAVRQVANDFSAANRVPTRGPSQNYNPPSATQNLNTYAYNATTREETAAEYAGNPNRAVPVRMPNEIMLKQKVADPRTPLPTQGMAGAQAGGIPSGNQFNQGQVAPLTRELTENAPAPTFNIAYETGGTQRPFNQLAATTRESTEQLVAAPIPNLGADSGRAAGPMAGAGGYVGVPTTAKEFLEDASLTINLKPKSERHCLQSLQPLRATSKEGLVELDVPQQMQQITPSAGPIPILTDLPPTTRESTELIQGPQQLQCPISAPMLPVDPLAAPSTQKEGLVELTFTGAPQNAAQGSALPAHLIAQPPPSTLREGQETFVQPGGPAANVSVAGNVAVNPQARETQREETGLAAPNIIPTATTMSAPMDRTAIENAILDDRRDTTLLNRMPGPAVHNDNPGNRFINTRLRSDETSLRRMGPINLTNLFSERQVGLLKAPANHYENSLTNHQVDPMLQEQRLANPYATSILTIFNQVTTDPFQC